MKDKKFVVLQNLKAPWNAFWTMNKPSVFGDNCHSYKGELWYKEVLFTDSEEEAMKKAEEIRWIEPK